LIEHGLHAVQATGLGMWEDRGVCWLALWLPRKSGSIIWLTSLKPRVCRYFRPESWPG